MSEAALRTTIALLEKKVADHKVAEVSRSQMTVRIQALRTKEKKVEDAQREVDALRDQQQIRDYLKKEKVKMVKEAADLRSRIELVTSERDLTQSQLGQYDALRYKAGRAETIKKLNQELCERCAIADAKAAAETEQKERALAELTVQRRRESPIRGCRRKSTHKMNHWLY